MTYTIQQLQQMLTHAKQAKARITLRLLQGGHEMHRGVDNLAMHNAFRTLGVPHAFRPPNVHELKGLRPNFCAPIVMAR